MTRLLTTFGNVGLLRPAPGTWGSLAGLFLGMVILRYGGFPILVLSTVAITVVGFWAVGIELADRPGEDPGEIVIDEVAGQWLCLLFPAAAFWMRDFDGWLPWPAWLAAFLFFRLFDVLKPGPIGVVDRRGDAPGVMLDDLLAGLIGGVATLAAAALFHVVLMR